MTNLIKFSGVQANDTQSVSRNTFPIDVTVTTLSITFFKSTQSDKPLCPHSVRWPQSDKATVAKNCIRRPQCRHHI